MAYYKAQEATKMKLPLEGTVLMSINENEKKIITETAKEFAKLGFKIVATEGTHNHLKKLGIGSVQIFKMHEGRPNIADAIKNGEIQLIINTPAGKQSKNDDSYIRKSAIKYSIPYITTSAAAAAAVKGIAACRKGIEKLKSLQEYHSKIK